MKARASGEGDKLELWCHKQQLVPSWELRMLEAFTGGAQLLGCRRVACGHCTLLSKARILLPPVQQGYSDSHREAGLRDGQEAWPWTGAEHAGWESQAQGMYFLQTNNVGLASSRGSKRCGELLCKQPPAACTKCRGPVGWGRSKVAPGAPQQTLVKE